MDHSIQEAVAIANFKNDVETIKESVKRIESTLKTDYARTSYVDSVAKDLAQVQRVVYSVIGIVGVSVIGAILSLILKK